MLGCLLQAVVCSALEKNAPPQEPTYSLRHFTDENGLPQNSVKGIAQDKNGFVWLATENGLTRFDGRQFRNFNASNLPVKGGRMYFIYPTADKNGLMAVMEKGEVLSMNNGAAEIATTHLNDFSYLRKPVTKDFYRTAGLPDQTLEAAGRNHFIIPAETNTWFDVLNDTVSFVKDGQEQYRLTLPGLVRWQLFVLDGKLCYYDSKATCFLVFNREIVMVAELRGDLRRYPLLPKRGPYQELFWNLATGQVFIYQNKRCFRLQLTKDNMMNSLLVLDNFDFRTNSIVSLYYNENYQRLFLGSNTKGLYIASHKQFQVLKAGGEENEVYYAQAPYGINGILTAAGVAFEAGKATRIPLLQKLRTDLTGYSLELDSSGTYWLKIHTTLYRLNRELTTILWQQDLKDEITQLYVDSNAQLWVGGMEAGMYTLDTRAAVPQLKLYAPGIINSTYIMEEDPETFWLGSMNGLYRMHFSSRQVDSFPELTGKSVRSIYIPQKGEIWITTYSDGIFLYRKGRLTALPLDLRQYIATAHCIIKGEKDDLWVTTNKGLFQFSRKDAFSYADSLQQTLFYFYFGKDQGFNTNEFNGGCEPCALRWKNGNISLPSLDGMVYFHPAAIRTELPVNDIYVDQVEVDTRMMAIADTFSLPHNFRQVKLHLSTPYFGDPLNLQLYYSLEAVGEEGKTLWLPVNDQQVLDFSLLSSGTYKLRIRKSSGFGKDSIAEKELWIHVAKAYYETTWFRVGVIGMTILLISLLFWLRLRNIQRKNRELEIHVSVRTRELKDTLQELQSSQEQLQKQAYMQQRLLTAISHDIKTPLEFLVTVIGRGYREQVAIKGEERDMAYESLRRMFHLVENLVNYMRSQFMLGNARPEVVDVYQLTTEKGALFQPVAQKKSVAITNDTLPGISMVTDLQLLSIIFHNLLDNAVKYTKNGSIHIDALSDENGIQIQLTDTGEGMPRELSDWINGYDRKAHVMPATHTGLGLLIVVELLPLIHGRMEVRSHAPRGTTVVLLFPAVT